MTTRADSMAETLVTTATVWTVTTNRKTVCFAENSKTDKALEKREIFFHLVKH